MFTFLFFIIAFFIIAILFMFSISRTGEKKNKRNMNENRPSGNEEDKPGGGVPPAA
jgi:hypothetical protein